MGKTSERSRRTRAELLQAFWRCYEKKPLTELTVKAVTQAAGYNRSTFYLYFNDMDDLLEQAEGELMEQLEAIAEETVAAGFSRAEIECGVARWADECGKELQIMLGPQGDLRFFERFKNLLSALAGRYTADEQDAGLLSEFTASLIVSAIAYLSAHPGADRARVSRVLHAYVHGGAMDVLPGGPA